MVQDLAFRSAAILLSAALATVVLGAERPKADEKSIPQSINVSSRRPLEHAALERALDQIVSADFCDAPLDSLLAFLKQYQIDAVLDMKALQDAGISADAPLLKFRVAQITVRSLLKNLARQNDLEMVNRDGRLLITTPDVAANELQPKVYRVADLLVSDDAPRNQPRDYSSLIDLITRTIYPSAWDEVGGPGSIGSYQGTLLISQTYRVHQAIDQMLSALRENRAQQQKPSGLKRIWVDSPQQVEALARFQQKSTLRADFKFDETPLADAVTAIVAAYDLPLILDARALRDAGIDQDTPVTAALEQVSFEDVVDMLLRNMDLTIVHNGEMIWITTEDVAHSELIPAVYPVEDLVGRPVRPISGGGSLQDFTSLIEVITTTIRPHTWDEVGGPGSIAEHRITSSLVISQTRQTHAEISRLLAGIREIRVPPTPGQAQADQQARSRRDVLIKTYSLPAGLDGKTVAALIARLDARSWNRGGHTLQLNDNQITVRHTSEMHRRIAELLGDGTKQFSGSGMGGMGGGMGGMGGGMM